MKKGRDADHLRRRLARYPKDWKLISARIRERSGGRCECHGECGLHRSRRCIEKNGEPAHYANGKIVLTVAHLNQPPEDVRDWNLRAMCQRCHLRYDAPLHVRVGKLNRMRKRTKREPMLFDGRTQ